MPAPFNPLLRADPGSYGVDNPLSQLDALNSLALGPLYTPRDNALAMTGAGAGPTAPTLKMPVLYHGTNEGSLSMHGPEVSLTPDRTQARGYANDYHRMDAEEPAQPVVHAIQATPGPVLDISTQMQRYQSGKAGDNADAFIAKLAEGARKDGYRYLQFDHPNMPLPGADPNGSHKVIISLHPDDDLGYPLSVMAQEAAKAKRLRSD